jgi:hypothetical protein
VRIVREKALKDKKAAVVDSLAGKEQGDFFVMEKHQIFGDLRQTQA